MMGTPKVVEFNKLCPKDWGRYDPRKPISMTELNYERDNDIEIEE